MPRAIYFNPANDPATWPHVVQYMIALGINGKLNFPTDYAALRAGSLAWPTPSQTGNSNPENLDDTWHAAVNSRGQYFSARDLGCARICSLYASFAHPGAKQQCCPRGVEFGRADG